MSFWAIAALWFFLALISDFIAFRLKIAVALTEILIGAIAAYVITLFFPSFVTIGASEHWIAFLAGAGAIMLTFLAGTEINPDVMRKDWKKVSIVGLAGFFVPFVGCAIGAYYLLGWSWLASWLAGVALSTTSVAVVYAVVLELGLAKTKFGQVLLAACFVNDLGTVLALGLIFAPFTYKTVIFIAAAIILFCFIPKVTSFCFKRWGSRHSEFELKFLLLFLFGLGALAFWAGSEPVLPAYILGMILALLIDKDHTLVKRLRGLTFGFLTPFYFLRAGTLVSLPDLATAPIVFLVLFAIKMVAKSIGVYPATKVTGYPHKEGMFITLLMSTGLTFGTIASIFGITHGIIDETQYSCLVAAVIASAVVPTIIANIWYLPKHLMAPPRQKDIPPELPSR